MDRHLFDCLPFISNAGTCGLAKFVFPEMHHGLMLVNGVEAAFHAHNFNAENLTRFRCVSSVVIIIVSISSQD